MAQWKNESLLTERRHRRQIVALDGIVKLATWCIRDADSCLTVADTGPALKVDE